MRFLFVLEHIEAMFRGLCVRAKSSKELAVYTFFIYKMHIHRRIKKSSALQPEKLHL